MKKLTIVTREGCPYCAGIKERLGKVLKTMPVPADKITVTDERSNAAAGLDHYYAPAFFIDDKLFSEGNGSEAAIAEAIAKALK